MTIDGRKVSRADYAQDISRTSKKCRRCDTSKESSEFYVLNSATRGKILSGYCKECWKKKQVDYRKNNQERVKEVRSEYYKKNREKLRAYEKKWRNDPENRKASTKYLLNRLKTNEVAHFKHLTRVRIRKVMNGERAGNRGRMVFLLGCRGDQALALITNGTMAIPKDYHIDHYLPCSHFDLTKESEQRVCFNWRNLRLISGEANMRKSDQLPADHIEFERKIRSALSIDSAQL